MNVLAFTSYEKPEEICADVSYFVEFDYRGIDNLEEYINYLKDVLNKKGNISKVKFVVNDKGDSIPMKFKEVGFVHFGNLGQRGQFVIRAKLIP